jgi:hypothetical protein
MCLDHPNGVLTPLVCKKGSRDLVPELEWVLKDSSSHTLGLAI